MKRETIAFKSEAEWLAAREKDITSTEAAALFGAGAYVKTPYELYHLKAGTFPAPEFEGNDRTRWGNRLEDAIARGIAEDLGLIVEPFETVRLHKNGQRVDVQVTISPIRDITGWQPIALIRRRIGLAAFFYAFLHMLAYLGLDREWSLAKLWEDVMLRTYIMLGMAALTLMIALLVPARPARVPTARRIMAAPAVRFSPYCVLQPWNRGVWPMKVTSLAVSGVA